MGSLAPTPRAALLAAGAAAACSLLVLVSTAAVWAYKSEWRRRKQKDHAAIRRGIVYFVGAGPGDPELITVRGAHLIHCADVIITDELAGEELLQKAPKHCEIIRVGKRGGKASSAKQEDINQLLVSKFQPDKLVVRLKGGDSLVFGRLGSEIQTLVDKNIRLLLYESLGFFLSLVMRFEIVPGISSVLAAPALVNAPITDAKMGKHFAVLSGHNPSDPEMNWDALAQMHNLIIVMGTRTFPQIAERLMSAGTRPNTPCMIVKNAYCHETEVYRGELGSMPEKVKDKSLSPAVIIIGHSATDFSQGDA